MCNHQFEVVLDLLQNTDSNKSKHIFLSYAHKDFWQMRSIYNELRLAGFRVWTDEQLKPGASNWQQEINQMLNLAECVICICSPHSFNSKWVNIELQLAERKGLKIYPILVMGSEDEAIPLSLINVQFTDCRQEYVLPLQRLIEELIDCHETVLMADFRSIFEENGIKWVRFGSLFWFASEIRKLRLFFVPELPDKERLKDSLAQLLHHAKRLNVDKFTIRDIEDISENVEKLDVNSLKNERRSFFENKLRLIQDKVAGLAEKTDVSFEDGPRPGKPINFSRENLEYSSEEDLNR